MRTSRLTVCALAVAIALVALPNAAMAFTVKGASGETTQDAYGRWYAGQPKCAGARCHTDLVNQVTVHSAMVTDVRANPSKLSPTLWPAPYPWNPLFGSFQLQASDIWLQLGNPYAQKELVGSSDTTKAPGVAIAGDAILFDGAETDNQGAWEATSTNITPTPYSQSCSGCHNLGVTRPSKATYTLANGGTQSTSTPSGVVGLSIQCEVCHGTGKNPGGHQPGIPGVVGGYQILKSQVCGQCHETGTTAELNWNGSAFGNPNGYTTDATLSAFITPNTSVPSTTTFLNYVNNGIGAKPKFLPNGDDYSMNHTYYNEWLVSKVPVSGGGSHGHADPVNASVVSKANSGETRCLGCHSGLGFLNRIGATTPIGSKIVTDAPSLATVQASDPGISCMVCHSGHVVSSSDGKSFDASRKWASGKAVECEDCHNWQFEALDQPVQRERVGATIYIRPAANQRVRHAEREIFSGGDGGDNGNGGLWGVAPMGKFMPTATCESCHMPKTYTTRVSHRFHVTEPGDAVAWKIAVGHDSCTQPGCHTQSAADYTQTDFQQWINSIQSGTIRNENDATQSLGAVSANLGMTGMWTDFIAAQPTTGAASALSAAEWKMLQKSAQNADFVIGDGSSGVHQPQYTAEGLNKASIWARSYAAQITASEQTRIDGANGVKITGTLVGNDGKALVGATVALEQSTDGGVTWNVVQTAKLPSTSFTFKTTALSGDTLFRCSYTPDDGVIYLSSVMSVSVPLTIVSATPNLALTDWVDSNVSLTLSTSDADSFTMYSMSGATVQPPTIYTGPFTIHADGTTTLTYWSIGVQGTELAKTQQICVDQSTPNVLCDARATYTDSASFNLTAVDSYSGPALLEYSLDGGPWVKSAGTSDTIATDVLGHHVLSARATNNLGHRSAPQSWGFSVISRLAVTTTPGSSTVSLKSGKSWKYALMLRKPDGTAAAGKTVWLQRSPNGSSWSTVVSLSTNSGGSASRTATFKTRGTSYWRWYVPADAKYYSAMSGRIKLVVK